MFAPSRRSQWRCTAASFFLVSSALAFSQTLFRRAIFASSKASRNAQNNWGGSASFSRTSRTVCAFTFRRLLLSFEMPLVILDEKRRQDRRFAYIQYHTLDGKSIHRLAIQGRSACQLSVARLVVDWRAIHWPFLVSRICGIHIPGIKHRASKSEILRGVDAISG